MFSDLILKVFLFYSSNSKKSARQIVPKISLTVGGWDKKPQGGFRGFGADAADWDNFLYGVHETICTCLKRLLLQTCANSLMNTPMLFA